MLNTTGTIVQATSYGQQLYAFCLCGERQAEFAKVVKDERQGTHKTYLDTQAATKILKTTQTLLVLLTESPFVKYLYIGAN
jgi:hypothetical protein